MIFVLEHVRFLVVDFDCLKRLGTGVDCVGPLRVAVSQLPDEPNQLDVQFLVADRPSADHIMLHAMLGSGNDNVSMRALPRYVFLKSALLLQNC